MRKFYLSFTKCETVSHKLTRRLYFELLKCDNQMELQISYLQLAISCIYQRKKNFRLSLICYWWEKNNLYAKITGDTDKTTKTLNDEKSYKQVMEEAISSSNF